MESRIKVKATYDQMVFFERHFCVKMWERVKPMNDKKGRWLYDVYLRHGEVHRKLKGTFTVETLMEKLRQEAVHDNSPIIEMRRALDSLQKEAEFFGEKNRITDVLNKVLAEKGFSLRVL